MNRRILERVAWRKVLLAGAILVALVIFWASGGVRYVQDAQGLVRLVEGGGWLSLVLFGVLFVIGGSLGIPLALFAIAAGLLWPFWAAFAISYVAGMASSSLGFLLSRYIARDFCSQHIPPRLQQVNANLHTGGVRTVIVLRLLFYLFPPVNWMLGLSRIRYRSFLLGSLIGALPGTLLYVLVGSAGIRWLLSQSPLTILGVAAGVALLGLAWWAGRVIGPNGDRKGAGADRPTGAGSIPRQPYEPSGEEASPVTLGEMGRAAWRYVRLAWRTVWPPREYRPVPLRRLAIMIPFLPVFGLVQGVHWIALLLDEVLFPGYRRVRPTGAVFVVGVPRSGTTLLHRVLARDTERYSTFALWELLFAPAICQRRLLLGARWIDGVFGRPLGRLIHSSCRKLTGGLDAVHRLRLDDAEEDFFVLSPLLACFILIVPFPFAPEIQALARFDEDVPEAERRRIMRFYYAMVQRHLCVHGAGRTFLSKNVSFTPMLDSLLKTFPGMRVVACVRPPREAVPSQISAMARSWRTFGNPLTPELFERRWLEVMAYSYGHLAEVLPAVPEDRRIVFEMDELRANVGGCVERAYRRFGWTLSPAFAEACRDATEDARAYRSRHTYSLAEYALDEAELERRYAASYSALTALRQNQGQHDPPEPQEQPLPEQ